MAKDKEILSSAGAEMNLLGQHVGGSLRIREPSLRMESVKMKPLGQELHCKFCARKFSSLQALGGHQNAHKRERAAQKLQKVAPVVDILPQIQSGRLGPYFPKLSPNDSFVVNGLLQVRGHRASDSMVYRSVPPLLPLPRPPCRPGGEPLGFSSYQRQRWPPTPTQPVLHNPQAARPQPPCSPGGEALGLSSYHRQWRAPPLPRPVLHNPHPVRAQPPRWPGGEALGLSSYQRQWWPSPPTRPALRNPQAVQGRFPIQREGHWTGSNGFQQQVGITPVDFRGPARTTEAPKDDGEIDLSLKL